MAKALPKARAIALKFRLPNAHILKLFSA